MYCISSSVLPKVSSQAHQEHNRVRLKRIQKDFKRVILGLDQIARNDVDVTLQGLRNPREKFNKMWKEDEEDDLFD